MRYYLTKKSVLKWLEKKSVYHMGNDGLYELDDDSFALLRKCGSNTGGDTDQSEFIDYCLKEEILTRDRIMGRRAPVTRSPDPSLRYLELQITSKCNLRCKHCYIGDVKPGQLSIGQIAAILEEFEEMQGLRVLITGGEPLLHSEFWEINAILPRFSLRKVLFTNGTLLNEEVFAKLNVDEIQISVDGFAETHDSLRGKGTFVQTMAAVDLAIRSGFGVSVSTMIHKKNPGDIAGMKKLFQGMGIREWTVDVPCKTGRLAENAEFQMSPEEGGRYLTLGYGGGVHGDVSGFACGLHLMAVLADGSVSKCSFYHDFPVGRVGDGLRECWRRIKPIGLDELKCDCKHLESCRGGCRYRAKILGDPLGKDLYRCAAYGLIQGKM